MPRLAERVSLFGLAAAAVAVATDVLYLSVIVSQGDSHNVDRVVIVATAIAAAAAAAVVGAVAVSPTVRALLLSTSAVTLVVWGVVGAFSIGVLLLVAAALAGAGAARVPDAGRLVAATLPAAAAVVVVLSIAALELT